MSTPLPKAKKSFGQNFLHDPSVLRKVGGHCGGSPGEVIVEIGAGPGALTAELIKSGAQVLAIERDRDLVPLLRQQFDQHENFRVLEADAKHIDPVELAEGAPLILCGNIPYNLSAPLLGLALNVADRVERVVYMVQKELGQRLSAPAGTRGCGALSVLLQQRFDVKILMKVGRGAFQPAPRVDSVLLGLFPLRPPKYRVDDDERFSAVVHAAFSQRRKQLGNSLKGFFSDPAQVCARVGVSPNRRAETLSIEEFVALAALPEEVD